MGAVVEQIQQTYELQVNGYYSQLHFVEDYILKEKEVSPETDVNQNFFEAWEKEAGSRLVFLQENGKAMTADGTKMRIDIPGKLLLALRNGHNIAKLVSWNYEEMQSGGLSGCNSMSEISLLMGKLIQQLEPCMIIQN